MTDSVIKVENVWKRYGLPIAPYLRQGFDKLRGTFTDRSDYGPWALRDISFEVKKGESLGIVGKNGAGKSTLLKLLAGVSPPTYGSIEVSGRMFPMIELVAGIHHDLSGRENIHLLGTVMGLTTAEVEEKMPLIEDFSELGDWIDEPMWKYSSGMQARLGFSVAVNVDADILLIDEVLSVGDVNFRKKCLSRMDNLASSGVTVLFVTHNPYAIERICNQAIYLDGGRVTQSGHPKEILTSYFNQSIDKPQGNSILLNPDERPGTGSFRIVSVDLVDASTDKKIDTFISGDSIKIRLGIDVREPIEAYSLSLRILDSAGTIVTYVDIPSSKRAELALHENTTLECSINDINLLPGEYWIECVAKEIGEVIIDNLPYALPFSIYGTSQIFEQTNNRGFVYLPTDWKKLSESRTSPSG